MDSFSMPRQRARIDSGEIAIWTVVRFTFRATYHEDEPNDALS